jgi:hypothetical protein
LRRNFYFSVDPPGFWGYHTSTEKELHFKGVMRLKPRSKAGKRENSFKAAPKKEENPFFLKFSVDVVKGFIHKGLKVFLLLHPPPRWVVSTLKPSLFPPGFQRLATKNQKDETASLRSQRQKREGSNLVFHPKGVTARWYFRFRSSLSFRVS